MRCEGLAHGLQDPFSTLRGGCLQRSEKGRRCDDAGTTVAALAQGALERLNGRAHTPGAEGGLNAHSDVVSVIPGALSGADVPGGEAGEGGSRLRAVPRHGACVVWLLALARRLRARHGHEAAPPS
jgi:hypothetical protein